MENERIPTVKVDEWTRDKSDAYIYSDGNLIKINFDKCLDGKSRGMYARNKDSMETLSTFIIKRRLFLSKLDLLCQYMDYFTEWFDEDKSLIVSYMYMKNRVDSNASSMTYGEFRIMLLNEFFHKLNLKHQIYDMVEFNYDLDVTVDEKTHRQFTGKFDFTNEDAKQLLAISTCIKFAIPIISHYIETNTLYDDKFLTGFMSNIFIDIFENMGNYRDAFGSELLVKMYQFTRDKVQQHFNTNKRLWEQQSAFRGLTTDAHIDATVKKHLIENNIFKFMFNNNIISFMKSIVETQLDCAINKAKYKANPVKLDDIKDANGLSSLDKNNQSLAKVDESQIIRNEYSLEYVINAYQEDDEIGEISQEEIDYYLEHFDIKNPFHNKLVNYFFAGHFDGFAELKSKTVYQYIKLMIIAKRVLINSTKYKQLPWLFSSVVVGRMSKRLLQNQKFLSKLTESETYRNICEKKYPEMMEQFPKEIDSILSMVITNIYTYVDYEHQELTGTKIEFNEDIICDELLMFIDSI